MDQALKQWDCPKGTVRTRPRLGFLGVGWIGANRLKSLVAHQVAEVSAICDPDPDNCRAVLAVCPQAEQVLGYEDLLSRGLDGIVIATPSAQHAEQALMALNAGLPVFCQKPLALDAPMTRTVVATARRADRLLAVDLSYRYLRGLDRLRQMIGEGAIGKVFAVDLVFHNAYGPDKPWYYQKSTAGGGCVMDLGTHLVDLMLRLLNGPRVLDVDSRLYADGRRLRNPAQVETYADVRIRLHDDIDVRLTCSWHLQAGREAVIQANFYGTRGGLSVRNVGGSFFNFQTEHYQSTRSTLLTLPSDDWWGASAIHWARQLQEDRTYHAEADDLVIVAEILDAIYGR